MRTVDCRTFLFVAVLTLCALPITESRVHAQDVAAATQLFELMEDRGLSEDDVEDRFYEAFSYQADGVEYVRPFRLKHELILYGLSDIAPESIDALRSIAAIFNDSVGADVSLRMVHVSQLVSIAEELPPHNYLILEPMTTFPSGENLRAGLYDDVPWAYLPRNEEGEELWTFPTSEILEMQVHPDKYEHTCMMVATQRAGLVVHSVAYLDTSMPLPQQEACIGLVMLANAGFMATDREIDEVAAGIVAGNPSLSDVDRAAILLSSAINLQLGTKRDLVASQIAQIWAMAE